ncbi:IclR family transcriptional regulator [Propioniciclava coleopterorum]|uniref:Glycerol operon regulatory protein n=1 Tax=Propioniciclava coleopterorum TaxID=2714937 RepID=A0A6G7Y3B4_9ACTN|nr:IclR family transcriptional regulator [Propioniciclava coleopterorum]QIK71305.1 IclR family transcriptional regulator [Propioniciclava coleopterorum]
MARRTPAVMRALDILELFVGRSGRLTAADIGVATDLPRTTVHELLTTLVSRGYLERDEAGRYRLGMMTVQLGQAYTSRFDLLGEATDLARTVALETGETCSVAVLQGNEVFYLAKVDGAEPFHMPSSIGRRLPASCTGLGKVLLSDLDEEQLAALYPGGTLPAMTPASRTTLAELTPELAAARAGGVAYEREESTPGLACAAAPIRDFAGHVVAAVSLAVPLQRWDARPTETWAELALDAAARISAPRPPVVTRAG